MKAAERFVDDRLRACLPHGVPPAYLEITRAKFVGSGKNRVAVADLVMFDGLPGKVVVSTKGLMPHRFTDLPGGDVSFEGGIWMRICPETLEPLPTTGESHE